MTSSPKLIAASLTEFWSPRVIAEVDDAYIKVAKIKGVLAWHSHDNEDELFLVLKGQLKIEMEDKTAELNEGDMFVVPSWVPWSLQAETAFDLFRFSDAPIMERLHFMRRNVLGREG